MFFELLTIGYFAAFALAAPLSDTRPARIVVIVGAGGAIALSVLVVANAAPLTVRLWLPHVYLVAGYWLPALLVGSAGARRFEAWLVRGDAHWRARRRGLPRHAAALLELCYLACYPALPLAFAAIFLRGTPDDANRFWCSVLAAGFACYAGLPWLTARPPWLTDVANASREPTPQRITSLNRSVLRHVSHQHVTFPSGHVAVSIAAALSLISVVPAGAIAMGMLATGIGCGAVSGDYHYRIDVLLGGVVGVAAASVGAAVT